MSRVLFFIVLSSLVRCSWVGEMGQRKENFLRMLHGRLFVLYNGQTSVRDSLVRLRIPAVQVLVKESCGVA
jgi:ribosomal protein S10